MDILKRILAVMVFILVVLIGAGLYYSTRHTDHGINLGLLNGHQAQQPAGRKDETPSQETDQKPKVILEPDLRIYIDEINKGISLINEANGLITSDPFFADPPKVPTGKLNETPLDQQLPKDSNMPILVLPDGTYQVLGTTGLDMRDIHRGIYKLGQGMTVLNTVLDRMNQDIRNNNFPYQATNPYHYGFPGVSIHPGTNTGMAHGTTGLLSGITVSTILYIILIIFLILAIVSVVGFVFSLFKPRPDNRLGNE